MVKNKVIEMIRHEVEKNGSVTNETLKLEAEKLDPSIINLSPRQFNARYTLQVRRKLGTRVRGPNVNPTKGMTRQKLYEDRTRARDVFLDFAREITEADKSKVVVLIASIDDFVDKALGVS